MEGVTTIQTAITAALSNVTTIFGEAADMIVDNEIAMVFIGVMLVGAGIGIFRRITTSCR